MKQSGSHQRPSEAIRSRHRVEGSVEVEVLAARHHERGRVLVELAVL